MQAKVKLTGLWKNESKGRSYLSGSVGVAKLLVFPNDYKKKDADPDYIAYLAQPEKKASGEDSGSNRGDF